MKQFNISLRIRLQPWFADKSLEQGAALLAQEQLLSPLFYRNAVAGYFPDDGCKTVAHFEAAPQLDQGFRLARVVCEQCGSLQKVHAFCRHGAALTLYFLTGDDKAAMPLPLAFPASPWAALGTCFGGLLGTGSQLQPASEPSQLQWRHDMVADLVFSLDKEGQQQAAALFPPRFNGLPFPPDTDHATVQDVWQRLRESARTETEISLNQHGQQSNGQKIDAGFWMWLVRRYWQEHGNGVWRLDRLDNGLLRISACSKDASQPFFFLTPQRQFTWNVLQPFVAFGLVMETSPAKAFSKVFFADADTFLYVEPWVRLADNETHRRSSLQEYRYGSRYSLDGKRFFVIEEQRHGFAEKQQTGLFAATRQPGERRIAMQDVPAFVDTHSGELLSEENEVTGRLRDFMLVDIPDWLKVNAYREDDDWCYLSAGYGLGSQNLDLVDLLVLRKKGSFFAASANKWLQLADTPLAWLHDLDESRVWHDKERQCSGLRLTKREFLSLAALVPQIRYPKRLDAKQALQKRVHGGDGHDLPGKAVPSHLRRYQRNGLFWLHYLYKSGIGGILADDMGLGKTHQALALLNLLANETNTPFLVVCPASVLPHWRDKIDTFYPQLPYSVYYGAQRRQDDFIGGTVILTTYGVLRQDIDLLENTDFCVTFFDEMQYLKNRQTATSVAASRLRSKVVFGLTGTPLENSLSDLKSLFDQCLPGLFGSTAEFKRTWLHPIEEEENVSRRDCLKRLINPFVLRRLRSQVLAELPDVIEDVRSCALSDEQVSLYRQVIATDGKKLFEGLAGDRTGQIPYMGVLALIQRLKQICNHPAQLHKGASYGKYQSGKWDLFTELLDECLDASMKVVVFSQYTSMLDIIEQYLRDRKIGFAGLRGGMSPDKRQKMVHAFENDSGVRVFCASLLAGGTGIDLTAAQVVIHYDRWWNAAREEQATARVHRFGQKQVVQVFKFITAGTLEEKIHRLISKKKELTGELLQADDASLIKRLSRDDLIGLLQFQKT